MTKMRFPYLRVRSSWQPMIPMGVRLGNQWKRVEAYIDSGATYTIFRPRITSGTDFDYRTANPVSLQVGNGDLIRVHLHELEVQIGIEMD
jgi:hypothetical protein